MPVTVWRSLEKNESLEEIALGSGKAFYPPKDQMPVVAYR